jgi:hypothetical protein
MKRIIDMETLFDWARDRCAKHSIPIWIGEDLKADTIMLIVGNQYAAIPNNSWLHDVQWVFEETIKAAEEHYK